MTIHSFIKRICRNKSSTDPEVITALLDILYATLLCIRNCPNLRVARIAASHAHNVPALISNYSAEKLSSYWVHDRAYLEKVAAEESVEIAIIQNAWSKAEAIILGAIKIDS